jgi:general secretion pathway protein G
VAGGVEYSGVVGVVPVQAGVTGMAATLNYAPTQPRRGAPWWLWTLAVLAVLALFYGSVLPKLTRRPENPRTVAAAQDLRTLKLALDVFAQDVGRYPTAVEGLRALTLPGVVAGAPRPNWQGPYLRDLGVPKDPWGHPYVYAPGSNGSPPQVVSMGPDGKLGSADDVVSP